MVKMLSVKEVVRKAKDEGLKIMIGGDMNAHIWELDKCENKNGKLLKNMVNETKLADYELCMGAYEWAYMVLREQ